MFVMPIFIGFHRKQKKWWKFHFRPFVSTKPTCLPKGLSDVWGIDAIYFETALDVLVWLPDYHELHRMYFGESDYIKVCDGWWHQAFNGIPILTILPIF